MKNITLLILLIIFSFWMQTKGYATVYNICAACTYKTTSAANALTLNPGDQVLFNKGETFAGTSLMINESGEEGNPIIIGSYGTGNNPIFSYNITIANVAYQTYQDLNIFSYLSTGNGHSIYMVNSHDITVQRIMAGPKSNKDWYAILMDGTVLGRSYNNVISDSTIYGGNAINVSSAHDNILVIDNTIYDCGETCAQFASSSAALPVTNSTFRGNEVYNYLPILTTQDEGLILGWQCYNCVAEKNYVHDVNTPLEIDSATVDCEIRNNLVVNARASMVSILSNSKGASTGAKVYNNTFIDNAGLYGVGIYLLAYNTTNLITGAEIYNNIVYGSKNGYLGIWSRGDGAPAPSFISDNNIFYTSTGTVILRINDTQRSFSQWQVATGNDLNSFNENPNLQVDYTPYQASPSINAGINLSQYFSDDYSGYPRVGLWDIGAYEFHQGGTPGNRVTLKRITIK